MADSPVTVTPKLKKGQRSPRGVYGWFDERMGLDALLHVLLDEPIPGGAKYAYVFGSALLAVFLLQIVTGIALLFYYTPAVDHAHTSVAYVMKMVAGGSFVRGLHVYGASAMVILLVLHVIQTFSYGAYKGRRELQWISGVVLFFLVLGMGFTGYLLPWDQKAYFATKVGTNVAAEVPLIGSQIKQLLLRGDHLGALTLSAFFVTHVFIIPALIALFVGLHLYLLRVRGAAGPTREKPAKAISEPFYPHQFVKDLVVATLVMIAIGLFAYFVPADLGPKANPSDLQYLPRPDWYFRFLFQWLKYWPGSRAVIGIVVIPGIIVLLFLLAPFIDRRAERRPWRRPASTAIFLVVLVSMITLTALSYYDDSHNPSVAAQMALQQRQTQEFMKAPFVPDTEGSLTSAAPAAGSPSPLAAAGAKVFQSDGCFSCHGQGGVGTPMAPRLVGISEKYSPEQLAHVLQHYSPAMIKGGMPKFQFSDQDLKALVTYLESLK
jgi:ubiquinol-cytochrome c reductase cytochrome b subunit